MNDKNSRTFIIATCIVAYSVILMNFPCNTSSDGFDLLVVFLGTLYRAFLIAALIAIAFIFVHSVENKVVEVDEVDEGDEDDE